jgi:hypothetical protein
MVVFIILKRGNVALIAGYPFSLRTAFYNNTTLFYNFFLKKTL